MSGSADGGAFDPGEIRALTFDVFGTIVDWRTSVAREGETFGGRHRVDLDWWAFADEWRALYQPSIEEVRSGERAWVPLDDLHRESLHALSERHGFADRVSPTELDDLNLAWHRLDPWPDVVAGLARLRTHYTLATLSNGNVALMEDLAAHAKLPWDEILGAEPTASYKPMPEAYLGTARLLDLEPAQCLMVAAHNDDLDAAAGCGFSTAFIARPTEHGPEQKGDLSADPGVDLAAEDLGQLASALGL